MNCKTSSFYCAIFLISCQCLGNVFAKEITFSSQASRVSLIELYTSEGCSSCPPADKWLGKFQENKLLWEKIVPVAFHVDYWDYSGWKDKFSDKRFAQRQYHYKNMNFVSAVYTPGVMKNGREWRGWRWWQSPKSKVSDKPGKLTAKLDEQSLSVAFQNLQNAQSSYILNVALLGMDITSHVKSGENSGETFEHDFVVLDFQQFRQADKNNALWNIDNPISRTDNKTRAIAIWINQQDDPTPVQAAGAWLN